MKDIQKTTLTHTISLPTKTIHQGEEIVDSYNDTLLIASGDDVDMEAISNALNAYPKMVNALKYFVERVEAGTIHSSTTYRMYTAILDEIGESDASKKN